MPDDLSDCEQALRKWPLPYSLALRLRSAGVARELICEYVGVEDVVLDSVLRLAQAKLNALQEFSPESAHEGVDNADIG